MPAARPTPLGSDVGYNGHRNGFFDNPVSLIFRGSSDINVVGAARREALPGLPEGMKRNQKWSQQALRRQMSALFGLAAGPICSSPTS